MSDTHLIRSKHWFVLARNQLLEKHPFASGVTVSLLQDAAETMCHAVAIKVGAQIPVNMNFHQYWDKITTPKPLPLRAEMGDLNIARVAYKHRGVLPATSEAERFIMLTHQFLAEASHTFFNGADFDRISEIDLVADEQLRVLLKEAERHLEDGDLSESLKRCYDAVELTDRELDQSVPLRDHRMSVPTVPQVGQKFSEWVVKRIVTHDRAIALASIGVNPAEYWLLKATLPKKSIFGSTYQFVNDGTAPVPTPENVGEVIRMIVRMALKVRAVSASIQRMASAFITSNGAGS